MRDCTCRLSWSLPRAVPLRPHADHAGRLEPQGISWECLLPSAILVPCFGTNGPLWSLANEFWYYLLFPILLLLLLPGSRISTRVASLLLAAGILLFLPRSILLGGVIWLIGAGVFYLIQIGTVRRLTSHPVWRILSLLLTIGALLASRSGRLGEGADLLIGVGCATLMAGLAMKTSASYLYGMLSAGASEISYTL